MKLYSLTSERNKVYFPLDRTLGSIPYRLGKQKLRVKWYVKKKNNLHNRERRQVTRSRKEFYNTARSLGVLSDLVPLSVRSLEKSGSVPLYERVSLDDVTAPCRVQV